MTRIEYMEELAKGLKEYDDDFAMDIMGDYRRHFDEAAKDGRSEESVCDELGSVEDFLKDIPEEFKKTKEKQPESGREKREDKDYTDDFGRIASDAGKMLNAAGKLAANVAGSVGDALNKLGDMFDKSAKEEMENEEAYEDTSVNPTVLGPFPGVRNLDLGLMYGDIEVLNQNTSNELTISLSRPLTKKEKMYLKTTVCEEDGSLEISQESRERFQFGFSRNEPITYYVNLPSCCEKLRMSTVSGNIKILCKVELDQCRLNTVSGKISVEEPVEAQKISVESVSGKIHINNSMKAQELKFDTVSGPIKGTICTEQFYANAVSGSIKLALAGACTGKLDTVSGAIKIKLLADTGADVKCSSMSGSLSLITDQRIKWDNEKNNTVSFGFRKGSRSAAFGGGGVKLKANSVSGRVTIYDFDKEEQKQ